ncbi:MAG: ribonuclease R, partial [Gammaproteobacteria bacterium]|nr:ribonuclease R [Gammaproteobacteria bacterium]
MSKRKPRSADRARDPYQAREAKKYENPIPSREFILGLMEEHGAPLRFDDLAAALELSDPQQLDALSRRVNAMSRDGQVVCNRRGGYCVVNHEDLI